MYTYICIVDSEQECTLPESDMQKYVYVLLFIYLYILIAVDSLGERKIQICSLEIPMVIISVYIWFYEMKILIFVSWFEANYISNSY